MARLGTFTFHVIVLPKKVGALPSFASMIKWMLKMPWIPWMVTRLMEEDSGCRWLDMEDRAAETLVADMEVVVEEEGTMEAEAAAEDSVAIAMAVVVAAEEGRVQDHPADVDAHTPAHGHAAGPVLGAVRQGETTVEDAAGPTAVEGRALPADPCRIPHQRDATVAIPAPDREHRMMTRRLGNEWTDRRKNSKPLAIQHSRE